MFTLRPLFQERNYGIKQGLGVFTVCIPETNHISWFMMLQLFVGLNSFMSVVTNPTP